MGVLQGKVWCGFALLLLGLGASARPADDPPAPDNPAAVLSQAMQAACSQNATQFTQALTTRNAQAFVRMTPAARMTLLKRFVLLERPGTPTALRDAAGNYVVRCTTPDVVTQMEIGKPEVRDNLAFLTLGVADASNPAGSELHQVLMGMVKENGQWKLLSLGLLLLDLPALETEWDRAEIGVNEKAALVSLRKLNEAIETYRKTYTRLPESLSVLGPAPPADVKSDKAGLVDAELAAGRKEGYAFRYVIVGANAVGAPAIYELAAVPLEYGRSGKVSYFIDSSGALHSGDHHGAIGSAADPKVE